jgi:DNA-binding transcriptional LysR family regulator
MNRYEVFIKVIETGSFSGAAAEMNYTQSAVSQMVHTLEEELSTTLVARSKNGVSLTADGKEYLPYIRAICNACRELRLKHQELEGLQSGQIRIGAFTSVSRNWLPQLMKRFKELHPGVQFELYQGEYNTIARWIREGSVDIGFINPDAAKGLQMTNLYRDDMLALLPEGHPLSCKEAVSLQDLAAEPFILVGEGETSVPLNAFKQQGLNPNVQYKVFDDYTIMSMVEQGLGVSALYRLVLYKRPGAFVTRPLVPQVQRVIALACKNRKMLPLASRCFWDFVLTHFSDCPDERERRTGI